MTSQAGLCCKVWHSWMPQVPGAWCRVVLATSWSAAVPQEWSRDAARINLLYPHNLGIKGVKYVWKLGGIRVNTLIGAGPADHMWSMCSWLCNPSTISEEDSRLAVMPYTHAQQPCTGHMYREVGQTGDEHVHIFLFRLNTKDTGPPPTFPGTFTSNMATQIPSGGGGGGFWLGGAVLKR